MTCADEWLKAQFINALRKRYGLPPIINQHVGRDSFEWQEKARFKEEACDAEFEEIYHVNKR